jgi:hypothetical protein
MTRRKKIIVDLTQIDKEAGQHWLAPLPPEELAYVRDQIRKKNRAKYLAERKAAGKPPVTFKSERRRP